MANLMGHEVILMEKTDRLGGHLVEASVPPFKAKTKEALGWLIGQIEKSGVSIRLGADTSPDKVLAEMPDAVIVAVGSQYIVPPVTGIENAVFADKALLHQECAGKRVIVIGGGLVGVETAMTLAENRGCKVTIVEMLGGLASNMNDNARTAMLARIETNHIKTLCSHKVTEITKSGVTCQDHNGVETTLEADTIIIATGLSANREETTPYENLGLKTVKIGDCSQARNIYSCFHEAWRTVFQISESE